MVNLMKMPISKAVALTAMISAVCSIWLIGDPVSGISVASQGVQAQGSKIENQSQEIQILEERLTKIESEFIKFTASRAETEVQQLVKKLRLDLERIHNSRSNSPNLPLPIAHYFPEESDATGETFAEPKTVSQEFELRTRVSPESLVVVQGIAADFLISVELMDANQKWIEMYAGPDLSITPASEMWVEIPGSPSTDRIRVTVAGDRGVEAVGAAVGDVIHWSMTSN